MTKPIPASADSAALHTPHRLGVILVGAGRGERLGAALPKAFVSLGNKTLIERCVETVLTLEGPGHLVVVASDDRAGEVLEVLERATETTGASWSTSVALGGPERHFSVMNGLEVMPEWIDTVLVHDIARPLTPASLFTAVAHVVRERGAGVVPVLPITDTVKERAEDGVIVRTVDRSILVSAQTPQGFPHQSLLAAYEKVEGHLTDDAAVVQAAGFEVTSIPGSPLAHKLTTADDLRLLEWMLSQETAQEHTNESGQHQ